MVMASACVVDAITIFGKDGKRLQSNEPERVFLRLIIHFVHF